MELTMESKVVPRWRLESGDPIKPEHYARILCTDLSGEYCVAARIVAENGRTIVEFFMKDGRFSRTIETSLDLLPDPSSATIHEGDGI